MYNKASDHIKLRHNFNLLKKDFHSKLNHFGYNASL